MNNAVFGKTKEKTQRYQTYNDWKRRNHLVSEPNYYTTKFFTENFFGNRNEKKKKKKKKQKYFSY